MMKSGFTSEWNHVEAQLQRYQKAKKDSKNHLLATEFRSGAHKFCHQILHNPLFESTFGGIIMFNLVLVIIETDAVAKDEKPPLWAEVVSWSVLVLFVFELALRMFIQAWDFWLDGCNIFDFVLVTADLFLNAMSFVADKMFPVSFLRITRLCKLARVSKAFRQFPELRLMVAGLLGSVKAIFWGTVLLTFALLCSAILAVQFLHPLNSELAEAGEYLDCDRCPRAYASVFDATLTFCQQIVAGDSWGYVSVTMIEHYPSSAIFYALVFMAVGLSIINLILGVVVDVASQARDRLKQEIDDEKILEKLEAHSHLLEICRDLDKDCSGEITKDELMTGYETSDEFREALTYMDINSEDLDVLWTILDADSSGTVSYSEFVSNCYKMKSSTTHFMLAYIKFYVVDIKNKICTQVAAVKNEMATEDRLKEGVDKLEEEERQVAATLDILGSRLEEVEKREANAHDIGATGKTLAVAQPLWGAAVERKKDGLEMEAVIDDAKEFIDRLTDEFNVLIAGIKNFSKPICEATGTRNERGECDASKSGLVENKALSNRFDKSIKGDSIHGSQARFDPSMVMKKQQKIVDM